MQISIRLLSRISCHGRRSGAAVAAGSLIADYPAGARRLT
jgi:hypothetical protein